MFFISPIKTVYSIKFYLQKLQEPLWKAFLFFVYLFVLAAVFLALYVPVKMTPLINTGIDQVAEMMPNITVAKGVITANNNKKTVIEDKVLQGYKIVFDTASSEPAYPTQMEKERVLMYVNNNTVYVNLNGQFQETKMDKKFELKLSKQELLNNKKEIAYAIKYFLVVIIILILFFRVLLLTIFALLVVFIMSAVSRLQLPFKKILILAIYLQGPVVIFDVILALSPIQILGMNSLFALVLFVIYTNLIFAALRAVNAPKKVKTLAEREIEEEE